ncbi:unnamed protein product [Mytilus coruscus]|uniref:Uncharacterized protein n=1 Tax=Mytilus coruscus TaxID=42192 RepID=A0A6J8DGT5_MYTCO|nr:unnamed protein product [Mytilus coruscus]
MSDVVKTNYIYPFQWDDCGKRFRLRTASKGTEGDPTVMSSSSVAGALIRNQSVMATELNNMKNVTRNTQTSLPPETTIPVRCGARTPSPMRQLLNEEPPPKCIIPSDQLFSKYMQDLSPVNSPDNFSIDIDLEPQEPSITLYNPEPSPLVSIATIIDQQQPSPSFSIATSINHQEPTEQIL